MTQNDIVQKLWNLCDVLRDDGINYSDYVTELVLLLFIKMEYENAQSGLLEGHKLPDYARWPELTSMSGLPLLNYYRTTLLRLSVSDDPLIAAIYADAQTRLKEPRHLEQLLKSLDAIDWFSAAKDGLGDLYEGLLEKNASETKSGAGQYFTPRPLIDAIIALVRPRPGETLQDPAAGTAGFLIAADQYMRAQTDDYFDLTEANRSEGNGTGPQALNCQRVRELPVNLPPVTEQTEIVRRVETLFAFADRLEARLKAAQTAAQRLTPAVLAKAFRGELVPQDPADEPAAELLKRLAAQRAAATVAPRRSKSAC